ncbi:hypothetical protein G9A89_021957 [Geosiphon pyriformis]|nr:hypothetical protein G9A89_021957 [Geosiphon pyriformis]
MEDPKIQEAREAMDVLHEIATILNTNLDRETLSLCVSLCESGVNPEALAAVIKELRRESAALKAAGQGAATTSITTATSNSGGSGGAATSHSAASGSKT